MGSEYTKYYEQGMGYQKIGDYQVAAECFKKATLLDKSQPEAWYQAGFALIQTQRFAEAGIYLRRALTEYEREIQQSYQKDYNYYQKAAVLALLNEGQQAVSALAISVNFNPLFAEMALQSPVFQNLRTMPEFQQLLEVPLNKLQQMRFRGEKIRQSQLLATDWLHRQKFLSTLRQAGWIVEAYQSLWDNDQALAPQAFARYEKNKDLVIELSYYLDAQLIFMELRKSVNDDTQQAYRIYLAQKPDKVLEVITQFQNQVNFQNWEDFMEALIEVCKSLLFEMPDGRKVKVS